jgi:hypothetical protein
MEIVKTINLKFSDEEKEILNTALKLIGEFRHSDACEALGCGNCPFTFLCNYNSAGDIERKINNLLSE